MYLSCYLFGTVNDRPSAIGIFSNNPPVHCHPCKGNYVLGVLDGVEEQPHCQQQKAKVFNELVGVVPSMCDSAGIIGWKGIVPMGLFVLKPVH